MDRIAPWLQTNWDRRAAGNFILGGTGSGLAVMAALSELATGMPQAPAYAAAGLLVAAGLSLVWLEIGRPWRFLHVFFHPQTSWMTREALVAPVLLAALAAAAAWGGAAPALAAALLAATFLYCQARILRAATGIPAWREPRILPLIIATGLAEGAGAFAVMTAARGTALAGIALALGGAAVIARWLAWSAYRRQLTPLRAPAGVRQALDAVNASVAILGGALPLLLLLAGLGPAAVAAPAVLLAGMLMVGGGWLIKHTIVLGAAFNQGFALPHLARLGGAGGDPGARPGWS